MTVRAIDGYLRVSVDKTGSGERQRSQESFSS